MNEEKIESCESTDVGKFNCPICNAIMEIEHRTIGEDKKCYHRIKTLKKGRLT